MPVLSDYWFEETDFRGNTTFLHQPHPAGGWAWINWSNIGNTHSTLTWEREDREIVIDLPPILNTPDVLNTLDTALGDSAKRTSDLLAGWIPWRYVPGHEKDPARHPDLALLVRLAFNIHISTPWYCSDADGEIDYYLVVYLDAAGHLGAYVDWWSASFTGGLPFCQGGISDQLSKSVPGGIAMLQALLDARLAIFGDRTFDLVYLLPGSGESSGGGAVNVDDHVSLALLPR